MSLSDGDLDHLSAYLDGRLSASESAALERRLDAEAELRQVLADMRAARALLRALPTLRAPRDFTLTRAQVRRTPLMLLVSPAVSAVSAAAAVVLLVAGALLALTPSSTLRQPQVALMLTETAPAAALPTTTITSVTIEAVDARQSLTAQQEQTALMQRSAEEALAADPTQLMPISTATLASLFSTEPMNAMPAAAPETAGSGASEASGAAVTGAADAIAESAPGADDGAGVMMFAATLPPPMTAQPTQMPPSASPLPTQAPTRTASPSPTPAPTMTASATQVAEAPAQASAETQGEAEAAETEISPADDSAALLLVLGVALALVALVTIILRQRVRWGGR
jgi:hypothetical protein